MASSTSSIPMDETALLHPASVKQCCAAIYESEIAQFLLGDCYHPGRLQLTERLGDLLKLTPKSRVLDVASGSGVSAVFIAERYGCEVVGIDYSERNVAQAIARAAAGNLQSRVRFQQGDAERLPFVDSTFDAVVCECALCLFPDKLAAAKEFSRVLRAGGRLGLSDVTRSAELPEELRSLLAWAACIADAQSVESYVDILRKAGFVVGIVEPHDCALLEIIDRVRAQMLAAEILVGLNKLNLSGMDLGVAKQMARQAFAAVQEGRLGYVVIAAANDKAPGQ